MFYWKEAVVLIVLLGIACLPARALLRDNEERAWHGRLILAAMAIVVIAVSPLPLAASLLVCGLLLMVVANREVPLAATWLFMIIWTPAAGIYLGFSGLFLGVLAPGLIFATALLLLYIMTPGHHARRGIDSSDISLLLFLAIFWVCSSLRGTWSEAARSLISYVLAFGITYQVLSRTRIQSAERVLRLFVYAAAAASLLCLFESLWKWPLYAVLNQVKAGTLEGAPRMMLFRAGIVRAYGPFQHPLAGSAIFGMAGVAFFALLQIRRASAPLLLLGFMILLGEAATVSRTGIIAFSVGIGTFLALRRHRALASFIVLVGVVLVLVTPALSQADAQGSASYRYMLMVDGPRLLGNHVWLGYREALSNGMLADLRQGQGIIDLVNIYASLIIMGGIASLVPYLLFLATTIQRYRAFRRAGPDRDQLLLGQALLSMQVGFVAMAPFIGAWSSPMLLSVAWVAMLAALRTEALRSRAAPRAQAAVREAPTLMNPPAVEQLPALR